MRKEKLSPDKISAGSGENARKCFLLGCVSLVERKVVVFTDTIRQHGLESGYVSLIETMLERLALEH